MNSPDTSPARHALAWGTALPDQLCEVLRDDGEPVAVGGEADWRIAAYLYELTEPLVTPASTVPTGTYLRLVEGNNVRAYAVTGDARAYVAAIEAEYDSDPQSCA
ncbi:hypothetical protein [Actinoplanes derwentensis]|uniref:Uncharacterized protein n=1 Tax=Actinoplanes derwentensis TaxID=113562 RepID=A0A1H2CV39_9ACTN|nr:hypothetical protein [Actinoplanes derwentensis]GID81953.1 hypothetical protein Ade03nite_08770 [Actinoplanes derwentensis]SDT74179.1 hypothetical protein SAMN04489716_6902 [Actinoplanes derwentensis]